MSTGKRLAKRSILGTRVCAPREDGLFMCGVIQATKTESDEQTNMYCVYFDDKRNGEYSADEIIGPGFKTVLDVVLSTGQIVYVTHNGREVKGTVLSHRPDTDEVELSLIGMGNLKKRLDEVRLIESRKSARLQDTDTDYSRLAEGDYSTTYSRLPEFRRRASSLSIDVPYGQSGRKRRSSADDGVMDDCMAAMVLMSLSCSPKSPCGGPNAGVFPPWGTMGLASSSGASSYSSGGSGSTRATPSPPNHLLFTATTHHHQDFHQNGSQQQDEGIDVDDSDASSTFTGEDSYPAAKRKSPLRTKLVFQCTWPGCGKLYQQCHEVERHVRIHLGRSSDDDDTSDDHEEEFYYTEIEVDSFTAGQIHQQQQQQQQPPSPPIDGPDGAVVIQGLNRHLHHHNVQMQTAMPSIYSSSVPTLSHLDMARPAHEDPEYRKQQMQVLGPTFTSAAAPISIPQLQKSTAWNLHGYAASAPCNMGSPQKCMRLSPKPLNSPSKTSPLHRRTRSESRKCRKVYGMENRDMWCTQCKWKKACTRFVD